MNELISVVINFYNCEKFLDKCLNSVINQSYKNLDILIINDGSTDNSLKICEKYAKKDKRIRIITTENFGLSTSRNIGIDNALGEYLYFVDADDFIKEDVIEYLYNIAKKYNVLMSTCVPLTIFDYNYKEIEREEKIEIIDSTEMLKRVLLLKDKANTFWNKLYKKELLDGIRFEKRIINDMVVVHKIVIKAKKIAYSNQVKYYYLRHSNAVTTKGNVKLDRHIDKYNVSVERYNYLNERYPDLIENKIYLISNTISMYLEVNDELTKYLDEHNAYKKIKDLYNIKVFFYPMKLRNKIKIILFFINKNLCKFINRVYQKNHNNYKI